MIWINRMFSPTHRFLMAGLIFAALAGCSSGGGDSSSDNSSNSSTTISGKVSVSSSVAASKPGFAAKIMTSKPHGKPGSKAYMASRKAATPSGVQLPTGSYEKAFELGTVWLYDANHPEWLYPVASAEIVAGSYTLSNTKFAELNGNAYKNDQPIPAGKYTLYAFDAADSGLIALKVIVNQYAGKVVGVDLVAEPSDVAPVVQTILGAKKNTDGTYRWGSVTNDSADANYIAIAKNSAVQIAFSTAMNRLTIRDNISIKTEAGAAVVGSWQVSPDWKTAIFKPENGSLAAGNYLVTVPGKDSSSSYVKNIYSNALANTSTGYFTVSEVVDSVAPTTTVKLFQGGAYLPDDQSSGVDVVTAIRLRSNELLDVATLDLTGTPSLGAKPSAAYIGKDGSDYVYEFTLGEPLKVASAYTITVSGGKDLAGNMMAKSSRSFTTATAASLDGISADEGIATQNAQAQVKDVFGKWVRAMSDRNLAQVQSLMTGGYVYEYDVTIDGIREDDINRDSRLSLNEFSSMLQMAFNGWEQCDTTLIGEVTADIEVSGALAGMEFKLSATSTGTSQMCQQMAPSETMYAVLEQVNGAWYISRAAEGIDIRNKDLVLREVVTLTSPAEGEVLASNPATFAWQPMPGVTSYLLVIADDHGQGGLAVVVPSTTTQVAFSDNTLYGTGLTNIADVTFLFGDDSGMLSPSPCIPSSTNICTINSLDLLREGATYKWEVMGLGSNTFESFRSGSYKNVFRDITAISALSTYQNSGTYLELGWGVFNAGVAVPYNDWYWAYDAGSAASVTLKVTPPKSGTLNVYVSGTGNSSQTFTVSANVAKSITLDLYQGMNWVSMEFEDGTGFYLYEGFSITTSGGIPPAISIASVVDDTGAGYYPCGTTPCIDQWSYLGGTTANTVTISGQVSLTQVPGASVVGVSNWNASGAYDYQEVAVTASGSFTVTMDVYNGDNWFNFYTHDIGWNYSGSSYLGINTSAGSEWTPPITVILPTGVALMADYGGLQDWDASNDADNLLTLSGSLKAPNASYPAQYYVSSDGNWESGNLAVSGTSYTLPLTLYHGWNYVSIDDGSGHWYGVNIYTQNGEVPQLPVITTVAGQSLETSVTDTVTVDASTTGCTVTVSGTLGDSVGNALTAYWQGSDGALSYYDQTSTSTDSSGHFSVVLPVVGTTNGGYNYIDLYDSQWNWSGVVVNETSGCTYTPPVNTITGATVNNGDTVAAFSADGYGGYDVVLSTGAATAITVAGANSEAGKTITGSLYSCGSYQTLEIATASDGSWSLGQFNLFDGYNYISISDGYNSSYVGVNTSNGVVPPAPITLVSSSPVPSTQNWSDCGGAGYSVDMGGGTTLTLNGVLNLTPGSQGSYEIGGTSGTFTSDANGNFSINVPVINGDNYLYLYDADWNGYYIDIYVTNGYTPPPALMIDSPAHDASMGVGTFTVTGHIDSSQWSSLPTEYYAWVYDANSGSFVDYASDLTLAEWGYSPITVDASGNFSFSADIVDTGNFTEIYVYAYDPSTDTSHGNDIYINNVAAYDPYFWKPGTQSSTKRVAKSTMASARSLKRIKATQAKSRDSKRLLRR